MLTLLTHASAQLWHRTAFPGVLRCHQDQALKCKHCLIEQELRRQHCPDRAFRVVEAFAQKHTRCATYKTPAEAARSIRFQERLRREMAKR